MSTIRVNTIQDAAGADSSTPNQIAQGRAKAWINFNGTGTPTARDSFNVASITDNGVGDFTLTFSTAMPTANYVITGNAAPTIAIATTVTLADLATARTTAAFRIYCSNSASAGLVDPSHFNIAVFGD